jgi:hypothetical protein
MPLLLLPPISAIGGCTQSKRRCAGGRGIFLLILPVKLAFLQSSGFGKKIMCVTDPLGTSNFVSGALALVATNP